uniref:Methyl-accepting chemotaxis protein n=1 Tax=uncultured bacterium contig00023 TaxID=1181512 RepID=A0A806KD72_9BACT|nr:methyl-accepting chemotaxis protein [uncultured bacterium contig00023]
MKIRMKLFGGFFIVFAIGIILAAVGFISTDKLTLLSEDILGLSETRSSVSSILISHYIWRHGLSETVYSGTAFTGSLDSNTCSLGKWLNSDDVKNVKDPQSVELLNKVIEPHAFIHSKAGEIINLLSNGQTGEATRIFREEVLPKTQEVITGLTQIDGRYGEVINTEIHQIYDSGEYFQRMLIIFSIAAFIASVVLALIITSGIMKPIISISGTFKAVGEGDLTARTNITSKDEMRDFSDTFNVAMEKIRNLMANIGKEAESLQSIGNTLASNMTQTAAAVNQITTNIQSIKSRVINQSASVSQTHATMEQLVGNISKLNEHISDQGNSLSQASSAIEEMVANINSVTQTLVNNAGNVQTLQEASEVGRSGLQEVSADIQEIARESEGLLEINSVMENISSQTNLLSMNAAIEAAHAGEAGKGFAVVAAEIRKLAESSSEQSKTIGTVLKKIKSSIDKITSSTTNVLNKFEAIDSSIKTVAMQEENIRNAMEEQGVGSKQILEGISNVNRITREVDESSDAMHQGAKEVIQESANLEKSTQEITSGMNEMASGTHQINDAVAQVNGASSKNRDAIDSLIKEVSRFKVA